MSGAPVGGAPAPGPGPAGAPVRLVATDLDGTLLRSDGTVSARTRAALALARARGVEVVASTGRPPRLVAALGEQLGGSVDVAVCANGAMTVALGAGGAVAGVLEHHPLAPPLTQRVVAGLRAALPGILFTFELGLDWAREPAFQEAFRPPPAPRLADALELAAEPVTKLLARHPSLPFDHVLATAQAVCGGDAVATTAGGPTVEISAAGVTKAWALARLCVGRGVAPAEVLAFGDAPNDLELLAFAGRAVAVANAKPEVLAAVHEVTAANDEDGVALVLERAFALA